MIRKMNERMNDYMPNSGEIKLYRGISRSRIGREAAEVIFDAIDHGDFFDIGTAYWPIASDNKYVYAIVLGLDEGGNVCMKWGYNNKSTGRERGEQMTEYMDFYYPCTAGGDCWDNEIMIIARDNFGTNFPASVATRAATELINDFMDYMDAHNREDEDDDFYENDFYESAKRTRRVRKSVNEDAGMGGYLDRYREARRKTEEAITRLSTAARDYCREINELEDDDRFAYELTNLYTIIKNAADMIEDAARGLQR